MLSCVMANPTKISIQVNPGHSVAQKQSRSEGIRLALSLRLVLTLTIGLFVLGIASLMLVLSYRTLRSNKTTDVWAIFFLELEARAHDISSFLLPKVDPFQTILPEGRRLATKVKALSHYDLNSNGSLSLVSGEDLHVTHMRDLGLKVASDLVKWNSLRLGRRHYLVLKTSDPSGKTLLSFLPHPATLHVDANAQSLKTSLVYVLSRQGDLLYSNYGRLDQVSAQKRMLVQHFIHSPLWQAQVELTDAVSHGRSYGYFRELPETNLVLFAETPAEAVELAVNQVMRRLLTTTAIVALLVLVLAQIIIYLLLKPMAKLSHVAEKIADGNFDVNIRPMSFGEVRFLSRSLMAMVQGLAKRDRTIKELIKEQREMVRLEGELKIAHAIQANLLPSSQLAIGAGLTKTAIYEPAAEVAGDWYNFFFHEASQRFIIAIVDISGHGAGSSMFTAMAAAVFEEFCQRFPEDGDATYFFMALHRQLRRYGMNAWTASAQAVVLDLKANTAEVYNAGHLEPLIDQGEVQSDFRRVRRLASPILGIEGDIVPARSVVDFKPGYRLVLYTDGIIERRNPDLRNFGIRKTLSNLNKMPKVIGVDNLKDLVNAADRYAHNLPRMDDICVVVVQRAAA